MLTPTEAVAKFQVPVVKYRAVAILQKALLKMTTTTTNDSLAATRLLTLMFESNVSALIAADVATVTMVTPSEATLAALVPLQTVFSRMVPYHTTVKSAVGESKGFITQETVEVINEYAAAGSPFNILAVAVLLVMLANLQDT